MKYILTDVEGTTTSISFVHDTLFPFAKARLKDYVSRNLTSSTVRESLNSTKATVFEETQKTINDTEAVEQLLTWIAEDRKHPALKSLQGHIWEEGYSSGEIKGHVYEDVPIALKAWKDAGLKLGVYSSGSVKAQHLIFEFSTAGNLRPYFSHHFDTAVGHKREKHSYLNIINQLNLPADQILFLSDIKEELDAAKEAGMNTIQLVRQDDVILGRHSQVKNFLDIDLEAPPKI